MRISPGILRRLRDRARARRDGRRDGLLGIPTREEVVHPPALLQIASRADETLAELLRSLATRDARLRERIAAAGQDLHTSEEDAGTATAHLDEAKRERQAARDATAPTTTPRIGLSPRVYAVAIAAILIAEFPLNAIAFRLFGEAEVLTWIMTASLAVTLVLCAHGLGMFLRIEHASLAERRWILVLVALPVLAIVAIALIRARYLSLEATATGLDVLGPVVGSLVFLVINLLVYTGATMVSCLAHSPRPARTGRRSGARRETAHDLAVAERRLRDATGRMRTSERHIADADVAAEEIVRVSRAAAAEIVAYHRGLMSMYCAANLRARSAPEIPQVLREQPAIEVPAVFREADPDAPTVATANGRASASSVMALRSGVSGSAS